MKKTLVTALSAALVAGVVAAEETNAPAAKPDDRPSITTRSGTTYERCKVRRVEPDGLNVFHSKGIAKIPFTDLPKEYQKKYGYDPKQASEYSRQKAEARRHAAARQEAERQRRQLAATRAEFLKSVKEDGVSCVGKIMWIKGDEMILYDDPVDPDKVAYVYGAPKYRENEDVFVGVLYPAGTYTGPRYRGSVPAYGTSPEKAVEFMMKE